MSEGKVEQWMEDFADDLFDGVQPDVDDCIKLLVKHAPSPSEATNYDICTIPTHHPNMQAEAYERGVRDAAKLVKRHSPECWTKFDEAAEEILALLQANPYRAVVETEAKKEER